MAQMSLWLLVGERKITVLCGEALMTNTTQMEGSTSLEVQA